MHAGHMSNQQRTDRNRHPGPRRQVAKFRRPALSQCPLSLFQNVPPITTRKPLTWACLGCSCITKKNRRGAVRIEHDEPLLLSFFYSQFETIHDGSVASGDRQKAAGTGQGISEKRRHLTPERPGPSDGEQNQAAEQRRDAPSIAWRTTSTSSCGPTQTNRERQSGVAHGRANESNIDGDTTGPDRTGGGSAGADATHRNRNRPARSLAIMSDR